MPDIALYYPWMNVRDEAWLKAAALYWPRLAVMAPRGAREHAESATARVLRDELGFLVDIDPLHCQGDLSSEFLRLIDSHSHALVGRYGWLTDFNPHDYNASIWPFDTVHLDKLNRILARELEFRGLAVRINNQRLAMHPRLASVYVTALADRVAASNNLVAVTDHPRFHGALNGWTLATLTRVLLGDEVDEVPPATSGDEVAAMYAAVAIRTVVPAGLEDIPAERIVRARRELADEFDAFRNHVESLDAQFTDLARVQDPAILRARLDVLVERDLRRPIAELERGLRSLHLEPIRAVLGMTSLALPAAVEWLPEAVGLPVAVGAGGVVAATLIGSNARMREQARDRRRSPAGYLLGLQEELSPSSVVNRVRGLFRRVPRRPVGPGH